LQKPGFGRVFHFSILETGMNTQPSEQIIRRDVFDLQQRALHWAIALGVIFQLVSAWLVQHADVDAIAWADWHSMVGQALLFALGYRLFLLLRRGSGYWRLLVPTREQRHIVIDTLKFYLSLGRLNCPDWYAYNPVWQPIYLLMIILLVIATLSGLATGSALGGIDMTGLHSFTSSLILYFTILHIGFSVLHDIKGHGGQISAMLNGSKYFHVQKTNPTDGFKVQADNSVSLDSLLKKK
jgi:Ni/Fe-hydrogenase 1 B-type cytochrome subunit